jgi:hypothetical protein
VGSLAPSRSYFAARGTEGDKCPQRFQSGVAITRSRWFFREDRLSFLSRSDSGASASRQSLEAAPRATISLHSSPRVRGREGFGQAWHRLRQARRRRRREGLRQGPARRKHARRLKPCSPRGSRSSGRTESISTSSPRRDRHRYFAGQHPRVRVRCEHEAERGRAPASTDDNVLPIPLVL